MFQVKRALLWGFLVAALACGGVGNRPSGARAFIHWASEHLIPIQSLESSLPSEARQRIRSSLESARVVGLGESRHDTREQLLLKGLLVRYLVEEMGFRGLILEESFPHAQSLDRYVTSGEGDLREIMDHLAGWYLWDTEEMLELFEWLRVFNEGRPADRQVRVFGMDITAPAPGVRGVLNALENAGVKVRLDAEALGLDLQRGDYWPATWGRYSALPEERRKELGEGYRELMDLLRAERARLVAASSESAYERLLWMGEVGGMGNEFFSSGDRKEGGAIREHGMARTTMWILDREIPGGKAILWAHNLHVARSPFRVPGFVEGMLEPMGVELRQELGEDYIAVGGTFGTGSYSPDLPPGERRFEAVSRDIMDGALDRTGVRLFLIDLRGAEQDPAASRWLSREREWRAQDMRAVLVPGAAFDLVYFVGEISRSQPTARALERFQSLGAHH